MKHSLSLLLPFLIGAQDAAPPRVEQLADGIHRIVVDGGFPANVTVAVGEEGLLLVDSGFPDTADDLGRALEGLSSRPVRTIINTHPHGDHVGGNGLLAPGGTLVGHRDAKGVSKGAPNATAISEPTVLEFADQMIHMVPFPGGHSHADLAIHFEQGKVLCLGDMYLSESFPTVAVGHGGSAKVLLENLEQVLETFPQDVMVVPGHGRVTTMAGLRSYVDRMKDTVAIVRREMAAGKELEQIQRERALRDYVVWGKFFPFIDEATWIRCIFAGYSDLPPITDEEWARELAAAIPKDLPSARLSILFNHVAVSEDFQTEWGFACLVEGYSEPLLFDTGLNGEMLLANMEALEIDPWGIRRVLLSHSHGDHTRGFGPLAEIHPELHAYPLASFPPAVNRSLAEAASETTYVTFPRQILLGIHTTGAMGASIPEQALLLDTSKGLVVMTGCAHPGILRMVRRAKQLLHREIHLVIGGFHLGQASDEELAEIIRELKDIGVRHVASTHCSGERAVELFREAWGEDFVEALCGSVIPL